MLEIKGEEKMKEVWFFLIRTNTGEIKDSDWYDSFEEADRDRCNWQNENICEESITPVLKGYV